ncbi:hypothetical protein COHA_009352 [Chlorella ohadii]|uniref:Peptidase S1 domain-containing protein n=1 Tax=Chlorella ohadii TaxID=2649997 RepID=A0AAD5H0Q3_9CHLO|nr:hypothetical protein COHA_009352 [Chlorella ohadii]
MRQDRPRFEFVGGLFSNRPGGGFFCAGTLIAPRIFMTAAHCVVNETTGEPKPAPTFWPKVHIGAYNRTQGSGIDLRTALVTRPHPSFGYADKDIERKFFNDVAIMLLDRPSTKAYVQLPPFVQKPQLPAAPGTPLTALGWGDTRPGTFSPSETLQQLDLALRPLRVCQAVFPKSPGYRQPENTLICAGNAPGYPNNICKGDSGGPLLHLGGGPGSSLPDVQLGISSFTHNASVCLGEPAGFTNLAQLGPWIAATVDELVTGLWVGRVFGDANVQTFSGQTYTQRGTAGQKLNVVSSAAYTLAGWLKRQPDGNAALGAAQFQSGPTNVAVGVVNGTLLVRLNDTIFAEGSTAAIHGGSLKFAAAQAGKERVVTLKQGRSLTIVFVQPFSAAGGTHAPRLDVSVRYRRMPDYQVSGLLGSTFPYQPKAPLDAP